MSNRDAGVDDSRYNDASLVTQFLYGDVLAFGTILVKHRRRIQKECYGVLRSADKAEEAAQEVFARALEKLHTLRHRERLGAWLKAIALNYCFSLVEREKPLVDETDVEEVLRSRDLSPEQRVIAIERQWLLAQAIERLPPRQRVVFQKVYVEGFSYKEVTASTGLSNKQVKSYLQNARRSVRQAIKKALRPHRKRTQHAKSRAGD